MSVSYAATRSTVCQTARDRWGPGRRTRVRDTLGLASVAALISCSDGRSANGPPVVRSDSAGIEIVDNRSPAWGEGEGWTVDPQPLWEVGGADAGPEYALFRVGRAIRFPDGRVAVANGVSRQIRLYDRAGRHLLDIGKDGEGPGEFRRVNRLWRVGGDSIMAFDGTLRRITVFDTEGRLGRTLMLRPQPGTLQAFGMRPFDDGTLLVEGVVPPEPPRVGLFQGGARKFQRFSADGEFLNGIAEEELAPNMGYLVEGSVTYSRAPFLLRFLPSTGDGEYLHVGSGASPQLRSVDPEGQPTRIIRWAEEVPRVDADAIAAYENDIRVGYSEPGLRKLGEAKLEGAIYPDELPVYQSLLVDAERHVWVERYRLPWEDERRWWIFDPSGRWLGEPSVPSDLTIREIGSDYILGVRRDEFDVESVAVFRLNRKGGS